MLFLRVKSPWNRLFRWPNNAESSFERTELRTVADGNLLSTLCVGLFLETHSVAPELYLDRTRGNTEILKGWILKQASIFLDSAVPSPHVSSCYEEVAPWCWELGEIDSRDMGIWVYSWKRRETAMIHEGIVGIHGLVNRLLIVDSLLFHQCPECSKISPISTRDVWSKDFWQPTVAFLRIHLGVSKLWIRFGIKSLSFSQ